jgi:hypothetical protein
VTTDKDELQRHGFSEWSSINIDMLPVAIAYPQSTQDVSVIAQTCTKYKIPIGEIHMSQKLRSLTLTHLTSALLWWILGRR